MAHPVLSPPPRQLTPPPTQPNTPTNPSSTPIVPRGGTNSAELSSAHATSLTKILYNRNYIRHEREVSPSMFDRFLSCIPEQISSLVESVPEIQQFISTADKKMKNEDEFVTLIGAVARIVSSGADSDRIFVCSGSKPLDYREPDTQLPDKRRGLKPDFFTSRLRDNLPMSLSAVLWGGLSMAKNDGLRRSDRLASRSPGAIVSSGEGSSSSSSSGSPVLTNEGSFAWGDVQTLIELKSSSKEIESPDNHSNLILKAAEVLRVQWHRRFVPAFLICGTKMKMLRIDRSGVLVGATIDIREGGGMPLIRCIFACLVVPPPDIGLPTDLEHPTTIAIDGIQRLVVKVREDKFILGNVIARPPRGYVVGRGTVVHLARKYGVGDEWNLIHKSAWAHTSRQHEGYVLEELQGVEGVVELFAWDAPMVEGMLSKDDILRDFPSDAEFYPREFRQTVVTYIPESLSPSLSTLTLLHAWRSLYLVIDRIAQKGWVHRDLSWNNIRLTRPNGNELASITLIDFDLASPITGPTSGSPDRTGTIAFMPIEILLSEKSPPRHQELSEDEAAFWTGFLAAISRTEGGSAQVAGLNASNQTLEAVGLKKSWMVGSRGRRKWDNWFGAGWKGVLLKKVCLKIWMILDDLHLKSGTDEEEESGQKLAHGELMQTVMVILDQGIDEAREWSLAKEMEQALTLQPAHHG
ncbi:MAG: hypothetical protein M1840_003508 [Geoglossum simile]|nr:MAG: hypothetical protein M1840_003508 [Geoglossum simile]